MSSKIKETILGVSIAIIFVLFVGFGIQVFYPYPKYENYCQEKEFINYDNEKNCADNSGKWNPTNYRKPVSVDIVDGQLICTKIDSDIKDNESELTLNYIKKNENFAEGYCDLFYYCAQKHRDDLNVYNRNVFIISGIIGILTIILGLVVLKLVSVSAGLFGGGVLTLIYGTVRYWSELADWARFIILGIALAVLIYLGYKKFNKKEK
jgi:hypothetical protein